MASSHRRFKLRVWGLALGYFVSYALYSAFIKATTARPPSPAGDDAVSGYRLLPATVISTAVTLPLIAWLTGWWRHVGRRRLFGLRLPLPPGAVFASGLGAAVIIGTTTLAFSFDGVSIVLALVLMRAGVLVIALLVDLAFARRIRWFSWAALALSLAAAAVILADVNNYRLPTAAALTIAAYLAGYALRLPCMNRLGKSDDAAATHRYLVEEVLVAMPLLVVAPALFAWLGEGHVASELRRGFAEFFTSAVTPAALAVGALYACLYCFGTLIYLDCRENTFCVPLNRCTSLLAGVFSSYALALLLGQATPSRAQLAAAGLIVLALALLSPLHHLRRQLDRLARALAQVRRALADFAAALVGRAPTVNMPAALSTPAAVMTADAGQRIFLFVCSGNTCRSPMAATIGNAEITARLKNRATANAVRAEAQSAGLSARAGAPMMPEAVEALRLLSFNAAPHSARSLTAELAQRVERIFCMTQAHRSDVIRMFPSAADKTQCLDPEGDIEDPIGRGLSAYLSCARRIHGLVRLRLDEVGLEGGRS